MQNIDDIEYHADDYGLFSAQSQEILDCQRAGKLNAVSVMSNSPYLADSMEAFRPYRSKIKIAVHLNFLEGYSLCEAKAVSYLVDEQGIFNISFGKLLLAGFSFKRKEYCRQLCKEISAQIHVVQKYLGHGESLRIDGHAHWHMLPIVFDSLMQVLQEEQITVEYIRFPDENLSVYLQNRRKISGVKAINIVKVMVLKVLAARNRRKYRGYLGALEKRLFLGVVLSGNMTLQNVKAVLPDAIRKAREKGWGIELLAHPGGVYSPEDIAQLTHPDDISFLTRNDRKKEKEMFCKI